MPTILLSIFLSIVIIINFPISSSAQDPDEASNYNWMLEYNDPVSLAKEFIRRTDVFWSPVGKTMVDLTYKVGFTTARLGGRYILLESPNLVVDMVKGGAYSTLTEISNDGLLEIIKISIKTPDKACESIAQSTIKEGLRDYHLAFKIASTYRETGNLSENDAILFLCNRWNFLKLGIARQLYLQCQEEYDIDEMAAEKAVKESLKLFETLYKSKLDLNNNLPLIDAAFFIQDFFKILESKNIGLEAYPPYINYVENISKLNEYKLNELKRFGYHSCDGIKIASDRYTIIPGISVGHINANTTLEGLIEIFGKENVENKIVSVAEGTEYETRTFINQDELEISWIDPISYTKPNRIYIPYHSKEYITPEGVKNGISVMELNRINGNAFLIQNYEVVPLWYVRDWKGGALKGYYNKIFIDFGNIINYPIRLFKEMVFSSDAEWIVETGLEIVQIEVLLILNDLNNPLLLKEIEDEEIFNALPLSIKKYLTDYNVPCYRLPYDIPEIGQLDLNDDGFQESIIWFVGCPETRGRGIVFIFDGKNPKKVLAQYFGYEVSGPINIRTKPTDNYDSYKTIIIGESSFSKELKFDNTVKRYELYW